MREFLYAVAATLRNVGFADAVVDGCAVRVSGVRFLCLQPMYRRSFQFCGRYYRSGNVKQATLDLLRDLPRMLAYAEQQHEAQTLQRRIESINKSLKDCGLRIRHEGGDKYRLSYSASLEMLERVACQIADAQDIAFAPIDTLFERVNATFDSEGGFSLN